MHLRCLLISQGLVGFDAEMFTHMTGKFILAVGGRPQLLATWTSPWSYLSALTTWQPASPKLTNPRE